MEKSRLEWKVGLFVLIGLVLLAVLVIQFSKGNTLFRSTYTLRLHADNVAGLKRRAQVLMSGVQVGTVSEMALGPQGTNVTIFLSIYQTLRRKGGSFLRFLLSGEIDVFKFLGEK